MTRQDIYNMIKSANLPTAYYQFSAATAKAPPFICYYYPQDNDFSADNINYVRVNQLVIELYTDNKDFALEDMIESILTQHDMRFFKTEVYIDDEKMYMITYTMEVLIDAEYRQ